MARTPNPVEAKTLTITITPLIRDMLEELVKSELYGRNTADVASEFLRKAVRNTFANPARANLIREAIKKNEEKKKAEAEHKAET